MKLNDWQERALKTFIQAFFGVLIPEIVWMLSNTEQIGSLSAAWAILAPVVCSALSAGISAVWNIIKSADAPVEPREAVTVQEVEDDGSDV